MDGVWSGFMGQAFFWACIVLATTSYCSNKVHEFAADKRKEHSQAKAQKPAQAAKVPKSKASAPAQKPALKPSQILLLQAN